MSLGTLQPVRQVAELAHQNGALMRCDAACDGGALGPSPVLQAIGLSRDEASSSLRMALTRFSSAEEIARATQDLARAVAQVQTLL